MTVIWSNPLPSQPTTANCFPHCVLIYHLLSLSHVFELAGSKWRSRVRKKLTASLIELCRPVRRLPSLGNSNVMLAHKRPHSRLISFLRTGTTFIHQATNPGSKNECSLNCQHLWSYYYRHACYKTHTLSFAKFLPGTYLKVYYLHNSKLWKLHLQSVWEAPDRQKEERENNCVMWSSSSVGSMTEQLSSLKTRL